MPLRLLLIAVLVAGCALGCGGADADAIEGAQEPSHPPNVLVILTDDQGFGDAGCLGHPYARTPSIDRLAREGTLFRQFYVAHPSCSPSRAGLVTGRHPAELGIHYPLQNPGWNQRHGSVDWLDPDVTTVYDRMRGAGYSTAHFGKWHLCGTTREAPPGASEYGIEVARLYSKSEHIDGFPELHDEATRARSTDAIVDETIAFLRERDDRPFFVSVWTVAMHTPLAPSDAARAAYADLAVDELDFPPRMQAYLRHANDADEAMRTYCAALSEMDGALGRLLDFIDAEGLAEETLVLFASDNGPEELTLHDTAVGSAGELRGRKRSLYEGGIRSPLIARWPGRVAAGRVDDQSVLSALDLVPTLAALVGASAQEPELDGENALSALLEGPRERKGVLFWEKRGNTAGPLEHRSPRYAVRAGRWKLLADNGQKGELYDLAADPSESTDLSASAPDIVRALLQRLRDWTLTLPE